MSCIGRMLLCVTAVILCSAVRFIVLSAELSVACDKREGLRYVRWKIFSQKAEFCIAA